MDRDWDELPDLATTKIEQPALFITGENDLGRTIAPLGPMKALVPNVDIQIIPDAGHWVPQERPNQVNHALIAFLNALPR
jgi:pimeloyl-ACP methyl ester carboxylesterase